MSDNSPSIRYRVSDSIVLSSSDRYLDAIMIMIKNYIDTWNSSINSSQLASESFKFSFLVWMGDLCETVVSQ